MTATSSAALALQAPPPDRRAFLGGSDIAGVLGFSPWHTRVSLYHRKTTPPPEDDKTGFKVKKRGKRWESVVAEMLVEELESQGHAVEIVSSNLRYRDPEIEYFACEIDFEIRLDGDPEIINVELKTVHPFKTKEWGESGTDGSPVWYTAQGMWGLGVTGRRMVIIAPLFGADEIRVYPIVRDDETIAAMRAEGRRFWLEHVVPRVPPEPVSSADLALLFPNEMPSALTADEQLVEVVLRARAVDREIKSRSAEFDLLEYQIKRAMGEFGELLVHGKSAATWKVKPYQYIDQEALKQRYPKVYREVLRKDQSRQFALKAFGWDG